MKKRNLLDQIELETARDMEKRRKRKRRIHQERARQVGERTKIGKDVKERKRRVPPVPKNKSLSEIKEMDPEDPAFRYPNGHPRVWENIDGTPKTKPVTWMDEVRAKGQRETNKRRARVRKWDAEVVVAQKVLSKKHRTNEPKAVFDEDRLIAESILDLDEWDNEELIRGYRRNRNGRFGAAPQYIPREIQQEAFRRLVGRGERKLKVAYIKAVEALVELAHNAESEKVKLDAIKTLMERVVGKVPDVVRVSQEAPWEAMLADAIVPLSEAVPLELTPGDDGVYAMEDMPESEGEVETPTADAAQRDPTTRKAPSPSRRSPSRSKSNGKKKTK